MPRNKPKGNGAEQSQLIYDGKARGGIQATQYSQNWDFSTFPLLCEKTYDLMFSTEYHLTKRMPYCIFLHAMNEYLNAYLLSNCSFNYTFENIVFAGYEYIPTPIFEYINGIGTVKTISGLKVHFNLPIGGTPQGPLEATDDEPAMESGSFGSCTAETHNSYECYVSPYVTRKLIERTLYANTTTDPDRFGDWSPLPEGRFPRNGIANRNLLGYQKPEELDAEGVAELKNINFANDDTHSVFFCHSDRVLRIVSAELSNLRHHFAISRINFERGYEIELKQNSAAFIYLDYSKQIAWPRERLAEYVDILSSPESIDNHAANKAYYFGYKRKRSPGSVGPCYTVDGKVPEGWKETRNENFDMIGRFASKRGYGDKASLRNNYHIASWQRDQNRLDRDHDIDNWLRRHFIIRN